MPDQEREFKWDTHLDRFHVYINHTHMMMACDNNHGGDIMITSSEKCHRVVNLWWIVPWLDHSHSPPHVSSFSWTSSYHHSIPSNNVTRTMTIFIIITWLECFSWIILFLRLIHSLFTCSPFLHHHPDHKDHGWPKDRNFLYYFEKKKTFARILFPIYFHSKIEALWNKWQFLLKHTFLHFRFLLSGWSWNDGRHFHHPDAHGGLKLGRIDCEVIGDS